MAKQKPAPDLIPDLTLDRLVRDPKNRRIHTPRNLEMIGASLKAVGPARSIVIDENDEVLAGNGVVQAAAAAGLSKLRVIDVDADTIVAVRRAGLSSEQKRALAIFDNRASELSEWNPEQLKADHDAGLDLRPFWNEAEEAALASDFASDEVKIMAATREARTVEPRAGDRVEFQSFNCPLSVVQERTVRAALRKAKAVYACQTTGEALTKALDDWMRAFGGDTAPADVSEPAPAEVTAEVAE